ncbi:Trypacidin cluster transcriptional coactivator tpcD [Lasiodiplodia hormozganensis]|uniref:Trypacidin cluster transcriptional coactivator tpcD n=1 Tax=Lasiodiplodia hormozganensis TaxID=869390 RepID=A0AA39Y4S8_9PEZI|nr:Trypacidin cluster transcriptional coactivator tpcD [Lasiodiplodia hormozganensis]
MFLAETAAPSALKMPAATQRFGNSHQATDSAYNLAFNTDTTFTSSCEQRKKLQRQWSAYLRYGTDQWEDGGCQVLKSFDPLRLARVSVVEVSATSTETAAALLNINSTLHLTIQVCPGKASTNGSSVFDERYLLNPRISIQQRLPGTPQTVRDASVYILHLPSALCNMASNARAAHIAAEISAHVDVLRANTSAALLVLTSHLIPDPGTVDPGVESAARRRDLSLFQLMNDCEMEMSEFTNMLNGSSDSVGRLVVVNTLRSSSGAPVALELRYRLYTG